MSREEQNKKNTGSRFRQAAALLILVLSPAAAYVIFENITGDIGKISFIYTILNLAAYYLFYFLLFAIAGSTRVVYPLLNTALTIMALAEYFVVSFRSRPIMVGDFLAIRTAATVSGGYSYVFTPKMIVLIILSLCFSVCAVIFSFKLKNLKVRIGVFLGMAVLTIGSGTWFYNTGLRRTGVNINMWDPLFSYQQNGYILSTLCALSYVIVEPPEGYSAEAVEEIGQKIREEYRKEYEDSGYMWQNKEVDIVPENIICIMNESFSDLTVIGDFATDIPYLENFNSISENCIKGHLYMPVYGSMTSDSEYEFLTGNAISFTPPGTVPYQLYVDQTVYGLPLTLKDQGYTTIAMHPYIGTNWNRNKAFASMGFDQFLALEAFEGSEVIRGYYSDKATYEKIIELTEEKQDGEKMFIFDVTMQNHGGYAIEGFESQVHLTELDNMPQTEQYLTMIRESDLAFKYLLDYYKNVDEPTMIVMFGDHQPAVETEFYEAVFGKSIEDLTGEENALRYVTPFIVWTNYDMPSETVDKMSAAYLSSVVVERANLEPTDYQIFLDEMYKEAPVIIPAGYYNGEGEWASWDNWKEKKEYPILKDYYILHYNNMLGGKRRDDSLFRVNLLY